jgi:hypothetical protein
LTALSCPVTEHPKTPSLGLFNSKHNLGEKEVKQVALFVSLAVLLGCNAAKQVGSDPIKPAVDLSGRWEVVATSTMIPGTVSYVEFNATQDGNNFSSTDVQEFIMTDPDTYYSNCVGQPIGSPQGNLHASMSGSTISGSFSENSPHGGAIFNFTGKMTSDVSFSGTFTAVGSNTGGCVDAGSFVAIKTAPLSGAYSGLLDYPDGIPRTINLTAAEDSANNLTVTGTAENGAVPTIPIKLTGRVVGNLVELNGAGNVLVMFAWWDAAGQRLWIVGSSGYFYGTLDRQ